MKKIALTIVGLVFLNGCVQSAAMMAPAITVVSSGNAYKAGFQLGSNAYIKQQTGKSASEHALGLMEDSETKKKKESFSALLKKHILETRAKLYKNN